MMLEVGMVVSTNTSAKSIETRDGLYDKANHTEVAYISKLTIHFCVWAHHSYLRLVISISEH